MSVPAGMLLFDKPQGWTSHDAAEVLRRMLGPGIKVGHCGALDPLATGLLILLVGRSTRLQARMQGLDKIYSGLIHLGVSTDTGDITGKVSGQAVVPPLDLSRLQAILDGFHGVLEMPAPAYSAVKHQGIALYRYARRGVKVEPKLRQSRVYDWRALAYASPDLEHRLHCSSGTYVRSLADLVGAKLGCGATVLTLRRERVARFDVSQALTLSDLKGMSLRDLLSRLSDSFKLISEDIFAGIS